MVFAIIVLFVVHTELEQFIIQAESEDQVGKDRHNASEASVVLAHSFVPDLDWSAVDVNTFQYATIRPAAVLLMITTGIHL
jgi:hypothetical protein